MWRPRLIRAYRVHSQPDTRVCIPRAPTEASEETLSEHEDDSVHGALLKGGIKSARLSWLVSEAAKSWTLGECRRLPKRCCRRWWLPERMLDPSIFVPLCALCTRSKRALASLWTPNRLSDAFTHARTQHTRMVPERVLHTHEFACRWNRTDMQPRAKGTRSAESAVAGPSETSNNAIQHRLRGSFPVFSSSMVTRQRRSGLAAERFAGCTRTPTFSSSKAS